MNSSTVDSHTSLQEKNGIATNNIDAPNGYQEFAPFATSTLQQKTLKQKFLEYPKCVFFIFGNECCERFSYYGMKTVLTLYFINFLNFNDVNSGALYNGFSALCYYTPLLGCILADGYVGRYNTILWVSLLYAIGNVLLAVASTQDNNVHPWLDLLGLAIIGFGAGGIKPCVLAFGADQFRASQQKWLEQFFSVFYFCINSGGLISNFITPIFRTMHCMNRTSCYPLAFGVPAILMVTAVVFFIFGAKWYKKPKPSGNVFGQVARVIAGALRNKFWFDINRQHWLDHYMDNHMCKHDTDCIAAGQCVKVQLVLDIKALLRVLVMYLPMPFFWALYDQQGSLWIIQGAAMNGQLGSWNLLPDQVGTVNPIFILTLIPVFSEIIYPLMNKLFKVTPLRKMAIGGILAGVSYITIGFIQFAVNATLPSIPDVGMTNIELVNYAPCTVDFLFGDQSVNVTSNNSVKFNNLPFAKYNFAAQSTPNCTALPAAANYTPSTIAFTAESRKAYYVALAPVYNIQSEEWNIKAVASPSSLQKAQIGEGEFVMNINYLLPLFGFDNVTVNICAMDQGNKYTPNGKCLNGSGNIFQVNFNSSTVLTGSSYNIITPGTWHIFMQFDNGASDAPNATYYATFVIKDQGAIYTLTLHGAESVNDIEVNGGQYEIHTLTAPNSVSIAWQFVPYFIISVAEIFLSITGYEFSYTQAPKSMKSIILAAWLMASAVGDTIIIGISEARPFENIAYQYFLFAGIMFVVMLGFILLSQFYYEYTYYTNDDDDVAGTVKREMIEDKF